jgi:hypothetical protein
MKNVVIEKVEKGLNVKVESIKTGRPVNPNSVRQLRLKELELKRQNGELKKGRPIVEGSNRQMRLKELEMKRQNGELKKGRPSNPNSSRQMRLKELEMKKKLNGGKMPLGRPKSKTRRIRDCCFIINIFSNPSLPMCRLLGSKRNYMTINEIISKAKSMLSYSFLIEFEDQIENWDGGFDNCSITLVVKDQFVFINYIEKQYAYHSVKGFGFN